MDAYNFRRHDMFQLVMYEEDDAGLRKQTHAVKPEISEARSALSNPLASSSLDSISPSSPYALAFRDAQKDSTRENRFRVGGSAVVAAGRIQGGRAGRVQETAGEENMDGPSFADPSSIRPNRLKVTGSAVMAAGRIQGGRAGRVQETTGEENMDGPSFEDPPSIRPNRLKVTGSAVVAAGRIQGGRAGRAQETTGEENMDGPSFLNTGVQAPHPMPVDVSAPGDTTLGIGFLGKEGGLCMARPS